MRRARKGGHIIQVLPLLLMFPRFGMHVEFVVVYHPPKLVVRYFNVAISKTHLRSPVFIAHARDCAERFSPSEVPQRYHVQRASGSATGFASTTYQRLPLGVSPFALTRRFSPPWTPQYCALMASSLQYWSLMVSPTSSSFRFISVVRVARSDSGYSSAHAGRRY